MAFLMIRIDCGKSATDLNDILCGGDDTKPQVIMNKVVDLIAGIASRNPGATVDLAVRETTQAVTAQGAGVDATCTLT